MSTSSSQPSDNTIRTESNASYSEDFGSPSTESKSPDVIKDSAASQSTIGESLVSEVDGQKSSQDNSIRTASGEYRGDTVK